MSSAALAGAGLGSTVWIAPAAVTAASGACALAGASACGGVETEISAAGAVARVASAGAAPAARAATRRTAVSATAAMTSARALIEVHGIAGARRRSPPTTAYHRRMRDTLTRGRLAQHPLWSRALGSAGPHP